MTMKLCLLPLLLVIIMPISAHAQTAGAPCTTAGQFHESGTESLVCDSSIWKPVINYSPDGTIAFQVGSDTGSCTAVKTGRLRYSSSLWEYCNGSAWSVLPMVYKDCNISGKSIGYVCPDGSLFIGFSPDATNQQPLFTTRCDAGQTWNGSSCTGTRASLAWGSSGTARSAVDMFNGKTQTATLASFGSTAHPAASYCQDLVMHGRSDWYLPAPLEAVRIVFSQSSISGFSTAQQLLTSAEVDSTQMFTVNPVSQGGVHGQAKTSTSFYTRCIRRD